MGLAAVVQPLETSASDGQVMRVVDEQLGTLRVGVLHHRSTATTDVSSRSSPTTRSPAHSPFQCPLPALLVLRAQSHLISSLESCLSAGVDAFRSSRSITGDAERG